MEILQALSLILVSVLGLIVVKTREPLSQAIVLCLFGTVFGVLFVTYQAPAAALSQIVVGSVLLPFIIVVAIARVRRRSR